MADFPTELWEGRDRGLTIRQAAEILGYSRWTIARLIEKGELQSYGEHKRTRIPLSSIMQYWSSRTGQVSEKAARKEIKRVSKRHQEAINKLKELLK